MESFDIKALNTGFKFTTEVLRETYVPEACEKDGPLTLKVLEMDAPWRRKPFAFEYKSRK